MLSIHHPTQDVQNTLLSDICQTKSSAFNMCLDNFFGYQWRNPNTREKQLNTWNCDSGIESTNAA